MAASGLVLYAPRELSLQPLASPPLGPDEARVQVAGCGVCHTDIAFYTGQVRTRHALPLVLGHEIAGTVIDAADAHADLIGHDVIVPAVIPCDTCELCRSRHDNARLSQIMPGNHTPGRFATELVLPGRHLVPLGSDRGGYDLADLAVVVNGTLARKRLGAAVNLPDGDLAQFVGALGAAWLGRQRLARADLAKGQAASPMLEEQEKIA